MSDREFEVTADSFGWIKLSRKILQNDLWLKGAYDERSAWIYLMLSATYEKSEIYNPVTKSVIELLPGQILTSIKSLQAKWSWSYNKTSRYLDNLQSMGMITQNRTNKYTIITISNWSKYQDTKPKKNTTAPESEPRQNRSERNNAPAPVSSDGEQPVWKSEGFSSEENYIKFLRGEINEVQ